MTGVNHSVDFESSPDLRIPFGAAVVGLIPGLGYFALFLCGVLGLVDWVWLLADRLTVWFAPIALGGLIISIILGASSGTAGRSQTGLRACVVVSVLLMILAVPLMLVQLVSFFAYID